MVFSVRRVVQRSSQSIYAHYYSKKKKNPVVLPITPNFQHPQPLATTVWKDLPVLDI